MYNRNKYLRRKLRNMSEDEKLQYVKSLSMKEQLAYWRELALKAYRDELSSSDEPANAGGEQCNCEELLYP